MESDGAQRPSNLPSRKAYRDDYYALIFNGKKNPCVPLDMGRYGDYAPHTVEYQIYRGEATDSCGERTTNTGATNTGTGKVRGDYGTGIEVVQARAPLQVPVKYAKTTVPRWYRSAKAIER